MDDRKTLAEMLEEGDVVMSTEPEPSGDADPPANAPHNETPTEQVARLYQDSRIIPDNEDG